MKALTVNIKALCAENYPPTGMVNNGTAITEEEQNPVLTTERLAYFEKCFLHTFYDDDADDGMIVQNLDLDDVTYLKLQKAQKTLTSREQVLSKIKAIEKAIIMTQNSIDLVEQNKLLTTITVIATPVLAYKIICDCVRELESLLISTKQELHKL